jgi:ribosomal protein L15
MPRVSKSPDEAIAKYNQQLAKKEDRAIIKAEAMYEKLINQGKVTPANRRQIKEKIARKTGVYVTTDAD